MNINNQKEHLWPTMYTELILRRVLYTLCFFGLCIIDWVKGSLDGRTQMTATNMTGIVVAIIILSTYKFIDFKKKIFAIWGGICVLLIPFFAHIVLDVYPYKGQAVSALLNVVLYGFIIAK